MRGQALTIESILIGIFIAMAVAATGYMALRYFAYGGPTIQQTSVSATLCGQYLFIENLGSQDALITGAYGVSGGSVTQIMGALTLPPGSYTYQSVDGIYQQVVVTGQNFPTVIANETC